VKKQYEKTPAKRKIYVEYQDSNGKIISMPRWTLWTEEIEPENIEVLHWHDIRNMLFPLKKHKKAEIKKVLKRAGGKMKQDTKKGILAGFIELYFRPVTDKEFEEKSLEGFGSELAELFIKAGRWGLGCPYNCGRFWEFKPSADLSFFEPSDPLAFSGTDEQGNPTNGYLKWQPQANGSVKFICDNCKGIILLSK